MPINNLQLHNQLVAAILSRLLDNGIVPTMLSTEDFNDCLNPSDLPKGFDLGEILTDVITWLRDEKIVRFKNMIQGTQGEALIADCVITAFGIKLLESKSELLGGKTPAEVLDANKKGDASAASYVKAGSFLGGMLGGFTKSISG